MKKPKYSILATSKLVPALAIIFSFLFLLLIPMWFAIDGVIEECVIATLSLAPIVTVLTFDFGFVRSFTLVIFLEAYFYVPWGYFLSHLLGRYWVLITYVPIVYAMVKKPSFKISFWTGIAQYFFWDLPLVLWMYLCHRLGFRALEPFHSSVWKNLIVGSMPLPGDGQILSDLNVGLVVNMCYEFNGLPKEYSRLGIRQIHNPTYDISEPSLKALIFAIQEMKKFAIENPNQKIFVHCKGGRARATTTSYCYLRAMGLPSHAALDLLLSKRRVAERQVVKYQVVRQFEDLLNSYDHNFDALFEDFRSKYE